MAMACALGVPALAQEADRQQGGQVELENTGTVSLLEIDGRTLGAEPLPVSTIAGEIVASAQRADVWQETNIVGEDRTRRLLLTGAVSLKLGVSVFDAERAVLWISEPDADGATEVFAYLEGVNSPAGDAAVTVRASTLSVQGRVLAGGSPTLKADIINRGRPEASIVLEGERVLREQLRQLVLSGRPVEGSDRRRAPISPRALERSLSRLPEVGDRIFAENGVFSFGAGRLVRVEEDASGALLATGGVDVQYQSPDGRGLVMRAQRAVVYLNDGATGDPGSLAADQVSAIYLEGDVVASDGDYTVRGPKFLYDVEHDRGMVVDAVFYAYDAVQGLPLYLRAEALRQSSATSFEAEDAMVTNTAFARPMLSIGASSVTVNRVPTARGSRNIATAKNITLRGAGVPVAYFPWFRGDPERIPLQAVSVNNSTSNGYEVRTRWDLYSLIGVEPIEGTEFSVLADALFGRGPGLGADFTQRGERTESKVFAYTILNDTGQDRLTNGRRVDRDGEFRGLFEASHRATLGAGWRVFAEASSVSDVNFVDAFLQERAESGREMRTGVTLRRVRPGTQLSFEASAPSNDFVVQEYILQTDGYATRRLPEVRFIINEEDLFPSSAPGLVTYQSDTRAGAVGLTLNEYTPRDYGFFNTRQSNAAFGIGPNQSFASADRARGLSEDNVLRFDSRNELRGDLTGLVEGTDWLRVSPFAVGRFTGYDDQFLDYSPNETERYRLWAGGGLRLGTEVSKTDNSAKSKLLDINRVRHIVEPSLTLWHGATSVDQTELPVYDESVESLAEGTAVRFGLDQTWQTQRGGPGRWRTVDVLRLDVDVVASSGESERESPIGYWYDAQPELSYLGDFVSAASVWQASSAVALSGRVVHDNARSRTALATTGVQFQHTPLMTTSAEMRYLGAEDSTLANLGAGYELTSRYTVTAGTSYDTDIQQFQSVNARVERRMQNVLMGFVVRYNNIRNETSASLVFEPVGFGNENEARDRRIPGLDG